MLQPLLLCQLLSKHGMPPDRIVTKPTLPVLARTSVMTQAPQPRLFCIPTSDGRQTDGACAEGLLVRVLVIPHVLHQLMCQCSKHLYFLTLLLRRLTPLYSGTLCMNHLFCTICSIQLQNMQLVWSAHHQLPATQIDDGCAVFALGMNATM